MKYCEIIRDIENYMFYPFTFGIVLLILKTCSIWNPKINTYKLLCLNK